MSEDPGQQQRYCTNCGAEIRPGNSFCVSCGQRLDAGDEDQVSENTNPMIVESTSRGGSLLKSNEVRLVLYVVGALLFLIVTYLLLRYSVALGVLWIGLLVFVVAMVRRARGSQTSLEQQAFQAADRYRESARRASEESQIRYRQWNAVQAAERQRNEALRAIQREREARRVRFDRYVAFFEKARSGAQTFLEWWQAYEEGEEEGAGEEEQTTDELLTSAQERAEAGLVEMRGYEEEFSNVLQADSFGEADDFLHHMLADQEDFEGEQSVFPPLVAVHEKIKHSEGWATYRRELEKFIKVLEVQLGSPAVQTAPANRARFPEPGEEHSSQPPHEPPPEAEAPVRPPPSEPPTRRIREWTRTASTGQQWMVIGVVFVAFVALVGMVVSISNQQDESASRGGGGQPIVNSSASPSPSPSSDSATLGPYSQVGDEVTFEADVFGYPDEISYAGTEVIVVIVDYNGAHVAVLADPLNGPGMPLTGAFPGQRIRVSGTYQGPVNISGGMSSGNYDGVLANDVKFVDS